MNSEALVRRIAGKFKRPRFPLLRLLQGVRHEVAPQVLMRRETLLWWCPWLLDRKKWMRWRCSFLFVCVVTVCLLSFATGALAHHLHLVRDKGGVLVNVDARQIGRWLNCC